MVGFYSWYAIVDSWVLCPEEWQVPSDAEWTTLVNYVVAQGDPNQCDNPNGAENALKSRRQVNSPLGTPWATSEHPRWNSHSTHHGLDVFGFSGLPGGSRGGTGCYPTIGIYGYWWSSTELPTYDAWYRYLSRYYGGVYGKAANKHYGFSVRCLRDD